MFHRPIELICNACILAKPAFAPLERAYGPAAQDPGWAHFDIGRPPRSLLWHGERMPAGVPAPLDAPANLDTMPT